MTNPRNINTGNSALKIMRRENFTQQVSVEKRGSTWVKFWGLLHSAKESRPVLEATWRKSFMEDASGSRGYEMVTGLGSVKVTGALDRRGFGEVKSSAS